MRAFACLVERDELREVAMIRDLRVVVLEEVGAERVDLAVEGRLPPERMPRYGGGFDAAADASVLHGVVFGEVGFNAHAVPSAFSTTALAVATGISPSASTNVVCL